LFISLHKLRIRNLFQNKVKAGLQTFYTVLNE